MRPPGTVLLVDDEAGFRENVAERLQSRGFEVLQAGEAETALALVRDRSIDVALLDILMPGMDGLTLLGRLKTADAQIEVVMVTGQGSVESAVQAMKGGAFHYVTKPVRLAELEMVVQRAMEKARLARQNRVYREELRRRRPAAATGIVARSAAMRKLIDEASRVAASDMTVLIEGETGTGKGLLAEFIHQRSTRADKPFTVLNCGALTESLVDSELFGHEKGAFTGAVEARSGLLEVADGGALFLDEIGTIAPAAQVRLLRVLEGGLFRRVGSTREQPVDVRILAASNQPLEERVAAGQFREDLFHRLLVIRLRIPPLRERPEDILPLADHFLARLAPPGGDPLPIDAESRAALESYRWPGNVRELAHTMERASFTAAVEGASAIASAHLGLPEGPPTHGASLSLVEAQKRHIRSVLDRLGGNRQKAAAALGVSERHLYRLIRGMETQ
ncbi:MAG: sigma-54-dependent Fis family transcriptional regulator [Planctomycetes bacterium]|nr:sigma-54-dependent Fis family transcriptional regulator [Planctomycetota bacterium]